MKVGIEESYSSFLQSCADVSEVVSAQFSNTSTCALIAFGGINGGFAMPPFEFFGSTRGIDVHRFYCRDLRRRWYLDNVPLVGSNFLDFVDYFRKLLEHLGIRRTVLVGNSAGGYAALLMGFYLNAEKVIAFSPQTNLLDSDPFSSSEMAAWEAYRSMCANPPALFRQLGDLGKVFSDLQPRDVQVDIHFSQGNAVDCRHASHLSSLSGVNLIPYQNDGHALVRYLKEQGQLGDLLQSPFL